MQPLAKSIATAEAIFACTAKRCYNSATARSQVLRKQFQDAARETRVGAAKSLLIEWEKAGGREQPLPRRLALFNQMCTVYMRTRQADKVMGVVEAMRQRGVPPDHITYSIMLNAWARVPLNGGHNLPADHALQAEQIFQDMQRDGIRPTARHYHALMSAHAKAGRVEECQRVRDAMNRQGLRCTTTTFNIFLDACSKNGDTIRATGAMEQIRQTPGVEPNTYTWCALLSTYGRAEDVDGAYRLWLQMQAAEVVPDTYVLKALDYCFRGMPTLAKEISKEATALMDPADDHGQAPDPPSIFQLDLHFMSTPTARVAILSKLDELKEEFGEGSEEAMGTSSREGKAGSPGDSPALQGLQDLQVIVGRGRRSVGGPQLKATATATLKAMGLDAEQDPENDGRLTVPAAKLAKYLQQEQRDSLKSRSLHSAAMQASVVLMGGGALLAATYLIPKILSNTS